MVFEQQNFHWPSFSELEKYNSGYNCNCSGCIPYAWWLAGLPEYQNELVKSVFSATFSEGVMGISSMAEKKVAFCLLPDSRILVIFPDKLTLIEEEMLNIESVYGGKKSHLCFTAKGGFRLDAVASSGDEMTLNSPWINFNDCLGIVGFGCDGCWRLFRRPDAVKEGCGHEILTWKQEGNSAFALLVDTKISAEETKEVYMGHKVRLQAGEGGVLQVLVSGKTAGQLLFAVNFSENDASLTMPEGCWQSLLAGEASAQLKGASCGLWKKS